MVEFELGIKEKEVRASYMIINCSVLGLLIQATVNLHEQAAINR
jgi:hypothetical protein